MHNIWNRQAYMQGFDCETINKKSINMFERMLIAEYIYEVVIETSKQSTREDSNRAGISRKTRGEAASSTTYSEMNKSSFKLIKMYVDHQNYRLKLTYIIHGPGNSLYECKVLGNNTNRYNNNKSTSVRKNHKYLGNNH